MAAVEFNQQAEVFALNTKPNDMFKVLNESGLNQFKAMPFPTRKTEDWKYTSLLALTKDEYNQPVQDVAVDDAESLFSIQDLDANRFVFVNGIYQESLSKIDAESGLY